MSRRRSEPEIIESLKRFWAPIAGGIGAIVLIVEFIELWKGNKSTVTWVTAIFSLAVLVVVLIILGFSTQSIDNTIIIPTGYRSRQLSYPKYYRYARIGLVAIAVHVVVGGHLLQVRLQELERKTVVLIANFDGPDPQKYRFTENLIAELQYAFQGYDEILIIPLDLTIREQQGSEFARSEGHRRHADLVIWGGYGIPDANTILTVHVEVLSHSEFIPLQSSELSQMQMSDNSSQNFLLQQQIAGEMKDLVNFVTGTIYLESGDSEAALRWLSRVSPQGGNIINMVDTFYYKGTAYINLEQYENAINDFQESLKIDPNNPITYYNLGVSYLSISRYEEAFENFDKAISLNPDYSLAYIGRGTCYTYSKEYIKAIKDFDNSISLSPLNAAAFTGRGNAFYLLNQYEQSINDLSRAIELDAGKMDAYSTRALAYFALNQYENAVTDYSKSIELEPLNAANFVGRGNVYTSINKYDLAISDYEKSISIDPQYTPAYYNLGNLYVGLNEYEKAISNFSKAIQINPQMQEAYFNRGIVFLILEEIDSAIFDFNKVLELTENTNLSLNNDAKYQLSLIYFNLATSSANGEKYEEAIVYYDKALSLNPNLIQAYNNKGNIYIVLGQTEEALLNIQKFVESIGFSSEDARVEVEIYVSERFVEIGVSKGNNGQYDQAITFLDKAIALDPQLGAAYLNRGVIYGILGRYEESIIDLNRALELNQGYADVYNSRGAIYSRMERFDEAILDLNKALELNPNLAIAYFNRGMVYKTLGEPDQAIIDFNKVLELIGDGNSKIREDAEKMLKELENQP